MRTAIALAVAACALVAGCGINRPYTAYKLDLEATLGNGKPTLLPTDIEEPLPG